MRGENKLAVKMRAFGISITEMSKLTGLTPNEVLAGITFQLETRHHEYITIDNMLSEFSDHIDKMKLKFLNA